MNCKECLARYTEYLDDALDVVSRMRMDAHLAACAACARYDRVMRRGLELVRAVPDAQPSSDFEQRLQHRIFHVRDERVLEARGYAAVNAAAAVAIAGLLAFLAWSPLLREGPLLTSATSPAVESGPPLAAGATGIAPLSSWSDLTPAAGHHVIIPLEEPRATVQAFPGPHSPLIVTPPTMSGSRNGSRAILMSYPDNLR